MNYHPVVTQLLSLIKTHNIWHETFEHEPVITSEQAANVRHGYNLEQGAKALIVKTENPQEPFVMFVLPGNLKLDSKKIKQSTGIKKFRFANEPELAQITKGVERGGVPPFGNIFNLRTIVDSKLFDLEKIIFNAGDRRFSIALKSKDYKTLVNPEVVDIS